MQRFIVLFVIATVAMFLIGVFNTSTTLAFPYSPMKGGIFEPNHHCSINSSLSVCGEVAVVPTFSGTKFAAKSGSGASPEGQRPPQPEKIQPKCKRPAKEYLEEAEKYLESANETGYANVTAAMASESVAASFLYEICSRLEKEQGIK